MLLATLILTAVVAALMLVGLVLLWVRGRRVAERLDDTAVLLANEGAKLGDRSAELLEIKKFHDEFLVELESLLAEAYRAKDKERVQQLQRMRERLETLRARTLDKAIRSLEGSGDAEKPRKTR